MRQRKEKIADDYVALQAKYQRLMRKKAAGGNEVGDTVDNGKGNNGGLVHKPKRKKKDGIRKEKMNKRGGIGERGEPRNGQNDRMDDVFGNGLFSWNNGNMSEASSIGAAMESRRKVVIKQGKARDPVRHGVFDAFNAGDNINLQNGNNGGNGGNGENTVRNHSYDYVQTAVCDCCGLLFGLCEGR